MSLDDLMHRADLWRGGIAPPQSSIPTGFPELDAELAGGGWPVGALSEVLLAHTGIGEFGMFMPALRRLTAAGRWLAFIAPPYVPYAPALAHAGVDLARALVVHRGEDKDMLWAAEQALRSGSCGAVLAWSLHPDGKRLRRLQLAAEEGKSLGVLFRPVRHAAESSTAALRLRLEPASGGEQRLAVSILKRRGGWPTGPIAIEVHHALDVPASSRPCHRGLHARGPHAATAGRA